MPTNNFNRRQKRRDRAQDVAFDMDAPVAERTQALAELQKSYMPSASDLMPMDAIQNFLSLAREDLDLQKASSNIVPFPSSSARNGARGMQSVQNDEFSVNIQGEYWERPSSFSFDAMRAVCDQTPVLSAVILTRQRQVQRFCQVAESGNDMPGFEIKHADADHQLTRSEKESIKLMNRFMSNCGWEFKPRLRKKLKRDSLSQFMAKAVRDSLTMDSAGIELEWKRDKRLGIDGFYNVDGATVRLCTERGYQGDPDIYALQLVQGRICTLYTHDELVYEPRNPRADVLTCGYGNSEVEQLIKIVTGYLNALTYNTKGFDSNSIPKGMLHLVGNYDKNDLGAFKRYWNAMVKGTGNAWNLPVMVSKDAESKATFEKFGVEFNEMYFAKWMTFLTSIICAVFGISPSEINFDSFSGGNTSPLSGSDTGEKLAASKDSGLRPLLSYFQSLFTDFIVGEFSDSLVFRWTGLDPEDKEAKAKRAELTLTVDEMRAQDGQPKHPDPLVGGAPVNNPALVQVYMAANAPQPEEGADGEPGGDKPKPAAASKPGEEGADLDFGKSFAADDNPFNLPILTVKDLIR